MATQTICNSCKGSGSIEALESAHDTVKSTVTCFNCNGRGFIFVATQQDEDDYRSSMDDW